MGNVVEPDKSQAVTILKPETGLKINFFDAGKVGGVKIEIGTRKINPVVFGGTAAVEKRKIGDAARFGDRRSDGGGGLGATAGRGGNQGWARTSGGAVVSDGWFWSGREAIKKKINYQ